MSIKFFLIINLFILNICDLYTDDCGIITNCPNKKYQYYFCNSNSGTLDFKCSSNPLTEPNPPYVPMMADYPVCLHFYTGNSDAQGPIEVFMSQAVGNVEMQVYKRDWNIDDGNKAAYQLNCICGKQGEPCKCEIYYFFSSNPVDFPPKPQSTIARAAISVSGITCKTFCGGIDGALIRLNNTQDFTGVKAQDTKKIKFFYNDKQVEQDPNFLPSLNKLKHTVYNLTTILKHELAHHMGLGHHNQCPPDISSGIMNTSAEKNEPDIPFSLDDICQFKKLYCPSLVPVEEENLTHNNNLNYPNPFSGITQIKFNLQNESKVIINIFNHLGKQVISIEKLYSKGENNENIDLSEYSPGVYYYIINSTDYYQTRKIVLIR